MYKTANIVYIRRDEMSKKIEFHGSDLEKTANYYQIPKEDIIQFGANVNPIGLSDNIKEALAAHLDIISSYPDRNYTSLKCAVSRYCGCSPDNVVVGNGSTELISLLISQRSAKKALVLGPTYSEYARELALTGGSLSYYNLKESDDFILDTEDFIKSIPNGTDLIIICNPNNPTSSAVTQADMEKIVKFCRTENIFVMVDETYVEFVPDIARITAVPLTGRYDNLMVIRGVSKFFAAPGLRFGYGITSSREFLSMLFTHQNPWSLNSIGAYAGELMLQDEEFIERTRQLIGSERDRLCRQLKSLNTFKVYQPYANFILLRILKDGVTSFQVFETAIKEKLMIRDCSSFQSLDGEFVRFCIMRPEDNERLLQILKSI